MLRAGNGTIINGLALCLAMEGPGQLAALQLLLFLLPPCHSDTLHRLLRFLSEVARHAESSWGPDGQEVRLAQTGRLREEGLV